MFVNRIEHVGWIGEEGVLHLVGGSYPVTRTYHDGRGVFAGVPSPFEATRYHSLIVHEPLPDCLAVTASTAEGEVMAVRHRASPVVGVQFHPESILTEHGKAILGNFLSGRQV